MIRPSHWERGLDVGGARSLASYEAAAALEGMRNTALAILLGAALSGCGAGIVRVSPLGAIEASVAGPNGQPIAGVTIDAPGLVMLGYQWVQSQLPQGDAAPAAAGE